MIYLLVAALILTVSGFAFRLRRENFVPVALDFLMAIVFGFAAGIFIGVGARAGMWAIAVANGAEPNFSASGTIRVIATFACLGMAFGIIYEGLLRQVLRQNGLLFGLILTLCLWYPFGEAAAQVLRFEPTNISFLFFSGVFVGLMFVPFGAALEMFLKRWHQRKKYFSLPRHAETRL